MPIAMKSRIKKWKREKNKRNKIRDLLFLLRDQGWRVKRYPESSSYIKEKK